MVVSYKIECNTNRTGFASGTISVIRRYSDFAWLSSEISRQCPGIIVPPLPEKQSVGRFSSDFVESRRRSLEKFLQRVAAHHEIGSLPQFIVFLQGDDAAFTRAKGDAKSGKPSVTSSAMAWFEGTINTISSGKVKDLTRATSTTAFFRYSTILFILRNRPTLRRLLLILKSMKYLR